MKKIHSMLLAASAFVLALISSVLGVGVTAFAESDSTQTSASSGTTTMGSAWPTYVVFGLVLVLFIVYFIFANRANKKKQKEINEILDSVKPGDKVMTIGRICGVVEEVDKDDHTFVLKTGSENKYSYIRLDRDAIYTTNAGQKPPVEEKAEAVEDKPATQTEVQEDTQEDTQEEKKD